MDRRARDLLESDDEDDAVVLVGLEEDDPRSTETRLAETVERVGGEIVRALGFDIYRVSVPGNRLDALSEPWVDYVERPDETAGPEPQGN